LASRKDVTAQTRKRKFKVYPIGYFHIDITEVATAEGKLQLFVAIDRTSKFAVARLMERANTDFLHDWVATVPYRIHMVLTDNGIQCLKTDRVPRRGYPWPSHAGSMASSIVSPRPITRGTMAKSNA
jgi:hypothetical protein